MGKTDPRFAKGFARWVLVQGPKAMAPADPQGGRPEPMSWQAVGRHMYGKEVFNAAFLEVIAERDAARAAKKAAGILV